MLLLPLLFILLSIVPLEATRNRRILEEIKAATQYRCSACNKIPIHKRSEAMQKYGGFISMRGFKVHCTRKHPKKEATAVLILRRK